MPVFKIIEKRSTNFTFLKQSDRMSRPEIIYPRYKFFRTVTDLQRRFNRVFRLDKSLSRIIRIHVSIITILIIRVFFFLPPILGIAFLIRLENYTYYNFFFFASIKSLRFSFCPYFKILLNSNAFNINTNLDLRLFRTGNVI